MQEDKAEEDKTIIIIMKTEDKILVTLIE